MRRRMVAVLLSAMVTFIAGCSSDESAPTVDPDQSLRGDRPAPEPQPFDIFLTEKLGLIEYAVLQLRDECLESQGYTYTLEQGAGNQPGSPFGGMLVTRASFGLASEEVARELGFGGDLPAQPPSLVSSDTSFDAAVDQCASDAWAQLSPEANQTYNAYYDLGNQLLMSLSTVHTATPSSDLVVAMADCMTAKGFPPTDREAWIANYNVTGFGVPFGSHEPSEAAEWTPKRVPGTVEVGPPVPVRRYIPTDRERELAVAWYGCDIENSFNDWYLDMALETERTVIGSNEAKFLELNPQIEELARVATSLAGSG